MGYEGRRGRPGRVSTSSGYGVGSSVRFCGTGQALTRGGTTISGKSAPRISATICTHNRAQYLGKALKSLSDQTLPATDFEVLVVDNASTDDTAALVESVQPMLPSLRYVFEGSLGLSRARNAAIRSLRMSGGGTENSC